MPRLLISKKGVLPKPLLFLGIAFIFLCVMFFALGLTERHFGDSEFTEIAKVAAPILMGIAGMFCLVSAFAFTKTYICVYDDHVEGVGIGKGALAPHNFCFGKNLNYTVQRSGGQLKVSCGSETYTVALTAADAQQVYGCIYGGGMPNYNQNATPNGGANYNPNGAQNPNPPYGSNRNPQANAQQGNKIAVCPRCGTKCRVPAGRGLIRITCPKQDCRVPFTFDS